MYAHVVNQESQYVIRNAAMFTTALNATIQSNSTHLAVQLGTEALFIFNDQSQLDSTGFSTT